MKKFSVLLFCISFFFISCSSNNGQEQQKEKVVKNLKITYNKGNDFLTIYPTVFLIPNYFKKGDSIQIGKLGVNWNYIDDTCTTCMKVRIDSVFYE